MVAVISIYVLFLWFVLFRWHLCSYIYFRDLSLRNSQLVLHHECTVKSETVSFLSNWLWVEMSALDVPQTCLKWLDEMEVFQNRNVVANKWIEMRKSVHQLFFDGSLNDGKLYRYLSSRQWRPEKIKDYDYFPTLLLDWSIRDVQILRAYHHYNAFQMWAWKLSFSCL